MNSALAYVNSIVAALSPLRDGERATAMAAYMKNHFAFLGVASPMRRAVSKLIPKPALVEAHAVARALWKQNEREYQYVAVDLLAALANKLDASSTLDLIEELALEKSWWDGVDGLAGVASTILQHNIDTRGIVWTWSSHDSFWVNRLAILHQNGWGNATDKQVLFKLCSTHAHSDEFFVRKAIGWALREYAWADPKAVQTFVATHRDRLSTLSVREALKNVGNQHVKPL